MVVSFGANQTESAVAGVDDLTVVDFDDCLFWNAGAILGKVEIRKTALAFSSGQFVCCAIRIHGLTLVVGDYVT